MINRVGQLIKELRYFDAALNCVWRKAPITEEIFTKAMERVHSRMMENNIPDHEIARFVAEWKGGGCPECGIGYTPVQPQFQGVGGEMIDHHYMFYEAQCDCYDKMQSMKLKAKDMERIGIPREYWTSVFSEWDHGVHPDTTAAMERVFEYSQSKDRPPGIVLHGKSGTGKTRCAFALMVSEYEHDKTCVYVPMAEIDRKIIADDKYIDDIMFHDFIMLDDMDKINAKNDWLQRQAFVMMDRIIREEKQFVITTNSETKKEFCGLFIGATADRLENSRFVEFKGYSYRAFRNKYVNPRQ